MQAPIRQPASRQAHVQGFSRQLAIQFSLLQRVALRFQGGLNRLLGFIDARTGRFALVGRHRTQAFQQLGQLTALAQIHGLHLLQ